MNVVCVNVVRECAVVCLDMDLQNKATYTLKKSHNVSLNSSILLHESAVCFY